jgi:hypothetical protein
MPPGRQGDVTNVSTKIDENASPWKLAQNLMKVKFREP